MADSRPTISSRELALLSSSGVPAVSLLDACRGCDDPCDDDYDDNHGAEADQVGGHSERSSSGAAAATAQIQQSGGGGGFLSRLGRTFGGKLGLGQIDNSLNLLGSVKNAGRTVVVATSKSDWPHSVTDEEDLYAHTISTAYEKHLKALDGKKTTTGQAVSTRSSGSSTNGTNGTNGHTSAAQLVRREVPDLDGLGDGLSKDGHERARNMTILCGNMHPYEEAHASRAEKRESIFIFPDYKMVSHLPSSSASELVSDHLSPRLLAPSGSKPDTELASYILPYQATILICSHKKRDKRCHITADPLIASLSQAIEELGDGWHVDRHGDEEHLFSPMRIEESDTSESIDLRRKEIAELRKDPHADKHVGIFKVSHVGGHKFAGQLLIWFPNGAQVWYGRVTPQDCRIIVRETFKKGRVVADLMRGGTALAHRNGSLWEW